MKLIYKIAISILSSLFVLKGLEVLINIGLEHNKDFKIGFIKHHSLRADIVIHGPCEAEWTIDPDVLRACTPYSFFNLVQNHSDFADNYLFLRTYLQYQNRPKAILLYVTPESFDSIVANTFNTYRYSFLLKDKEVKKVVSEMDPSYFKVSYIPFIRYSFYSNFIFYKAFNGYLHLILGKTSPIWPTGYTAPAHSYNQAFKNFRDLNPKSGYFLWSYNREKYFIKLIDFLKSKNIKLMVYESPVYYEAIPLQKNRQERIKKIDSICKSKSIPYFQFDSLKMKYDKKNYFSTYNTTIAGNKIFNEFLCNFLKDTLPGILNKTKN